MADKPQEKRGGPFGCENRASMPQVVEQDGGSTRILSIRTRSFTRKGSSAFLTNQNVLKSDVSCGWGLRLRNTPFVCQTCPVDLQRYETVAQ